MVFCLIKYRGRLRDLEHFPNLKKNLCIRFTCKCLRMAALNGQDLLTYILGPIIRNNCKSMESAH